MEIELELKKSLEENAGTYFDKAKKAKKKIEGAREALEKAKKQLEKEKKEEKKELAEEEERQRLIRKKKARKEKKKWYEKLRWFISSEGFLVIGGRDATTNEIVVKKQTDKEDIIFHTEAPASPFVVIKVKSNKGKVGKKTLEEAAQFCASMSRAWKAGLGTTEVYWVKPEQVTKKAKAGEYLTKGGFMIYGERNYFHPSLSLGLGITKEGKLMIGPDSAIKKHCQKYLFLEQGKTKKSDLAKKIRQKKGFEEFVLDEIIVLLPPGESRLVDKNKR